LCFSAPFRNSNINNIVDNQYFAITSTINIHANQVDCKNNSPIFKNEAVAIFCAGKEYIFNLGAVDPDRDSLSYSIVKSLSTCTSPVTYVPGWSEVVPFWLNKSYPPHVTLSGPAYVVTDTFNGNLSLNASNATGEPISGDLSLRIWQWSYKEQPAGSGNRVPYVVGITMRNLQLYNKPCLDNNLPRLVTNPSLPDGKPKFNWNVCAGEQICFDVTAKDTDFISSLHRIDSTYLEMISSITRPESKLSFKPTFDINNRPREVTYKFCWQTEEDDASTLPYYFTIIGEDNYCPDVGRVSRAFAIHVDPSPKGSIQYSDLKCNKYAINIFKTDVKQVLSYAELEIAKSPYDYGFADGSYKKTNYNPNPAGSGIAPRMILSHTVTFKLGGKYLVKYKLILPTSEPGLNCEKYSTIRLLLIRPYKDFQTILLFVSITPFR
jgi:hypothetical protein